MIRNVCWLEPMKAYAVTDTGILELKISEEKMQKQLLIAEM